MTFQRALDLILRPDVEGGDYDDPVGGFTRQGITQPAYDEWRDLQRLSRRPVAQIEPEEVPRVYRDLFWLGTRCPEWPPAVAIVVFDTAVQRGRVRAIQDLQAAVGAKVDGIAGPKTRMAVGEADVRRTVERMLDARTDHYLRRAYDESYDGYDPRAKRTAKGWLRRVNRVAVEAGSLLE